MLDVEARQGLDALNTDRVDDIAQVEVMSARILGLLVAVGKHLKAFKRELPSIVARVFKLVGKT